MRINESIIIAVLLLFITNFYSTCAFSEELKPVQEVVKPFKPDTQKPLLTDLKKEVTLNLENTTTPISLEQSLKTALDDNYNIKISNSQKNQNKWLYYNSATNFLPNAGYSFTESKATGTFLIGGAIPISVPPQANVGISSGFTAEWTGFSGFSRYYNLKATKFSYEASKFNLNLTKEQTLIYTTRQYYALLQNKLNIQILQKALEQTQAQLKLNQQRFDAGTGTKFDILRSEAEVAAAKQNLIVAENTLKQSQAKLANTLGIDVYTHLMPVAENVTPTPLIKGYADLNQFTQIAIKNKPELDIAKYNIYAIKSNRNAAFSSFLPNASMQTQVAGAGSTVSNLNRGTFIGLVVNWQAGQNLGLGTFTSIKALNEQLNQAKLNLDNTKRNIEENLLNSYYDSISAKDLINASQTQVTSAEESLRLSLVRLESGVGIYTDVINAQLTETQAKINLLNSIIGYNITQAQLLYDMGVISLNNLLQGYELKLETKKK